MKARKISIATEAAARRQNSVFNLLQQGKSKRYIMRRLRIPSGALLNQDIASLRGGVRAEHYFIPPEKVYKWSASKGKKIINFIEFAKKVIRGEATIVIGPGEKKGP